jgi:hypothetical protein
LAELGVVDGSETVVGLAIVLEPEAAPVAPRVVEGLPVGSAPARA